MRDRANAKYHCGGAALMGRRSIDHCLFLVTVMIFVSPIAAPLSAQSAKEYYELGMEKLKEGDYVGAIEAMESAVQINPGIAQFHNLLGILYGQTDNGVFDAIESFRRAIQIDSDFADAYHNLGTLYAGAGHDLILAEEHFERAIEHDPNIGKAYIALGWIYFTDKNDAHEALKYFEKGVELDPQNARGQYGLGLAYASEGKISSVLKPISILRRLNKGEWARELESLI